METYNLDQRAVNELPVNLLNSLHALTRCHVTARCIILMHVPLQVRLATNMFIKWNWMTLWPTLWSLPLKVRTYRGPNINSLFGLTLPWASIADSHEIKLQSVYHGGTVGAWWCVTQPVTLGGSRIWTAKRKFSHSFEEVVRKLGCFVNAFGMLRWQYVLSVVAGASPTGTNRWYPNVGSGN